jgi:hypothetical protein
MYGAGGSFASAMSVILSSARSTESAISEALPWDVNERPRPRGDDGEQLGAMVVPAIIASEEKPVAVPAFREPDLVLRATGKALRERNDVQPGVTKSESDFRRIDRFIEKTRIARDTPLRQRVERIRSG